MLRKVSSMHISIKNICPNIKFILFKKVLVDNFSEY